MKNYRITDTTAICLPGISACQSDISDSETGQIPITVITVIQNNINSESKLFEIKLQL